MFALLSVAPAADVGRAALVRSALLAPAALPLLLEAYARAPPLHADGLPPLLPAGSAPRDLVVVLPGAGGPDANTQRIVTALRGARGAPLVVEYDWQAVRGDELRASAARRGDGHEQRHQLVRARGGAARARALLPRAERGGRRAAPRL